MITQRYPLFTEKIVNLKKEISGPQLILNYYSNTYDIVNARLYILYSSKYKQNAFIRKNFKIVRGRHHLEFDIPTSFKKIKAFKIEILDYESNDARYLLCIDNLLFTEKEKSVY